MERHGHRLLVPIPSEKYSVTRSIGFHVEMAQVVFIKDRSQHPRENVDMFFVFVFVFFAPVGTTVVFF